MVRTLALQKKFLPLAELEPQLWYRPFHAITYRAMLDAEEEVFSVEIEYTMHYTVLYPARHR